MSHFSGFRLNSRLNYRGLESRTENVARIFFGKFQKLPGSRVLLSSAEIIRDFIKRDDSTYSPICASSDLMNTLVSIVAHAALPTVSTHRRDVQNRVFACPRSGKLRNVYAFPRIALDREIARNVRLHRTEILSFRRNFFL